MLWIHDVTARVQLQQEKQIKDDIKDCFQCVQHEMKNCLTFIATFAKMLLEDCSPHQAKFLVAIKDATKLLMFTISDWLDNTKLQNDAFVPSLGPFKIVEAVSEITNLYSVQLKDKQIQLRCTGLESLPKRLLSDRMRFQQVLLNFISNAVKYSPSN